MSRLTKQRPLIQLGQAAILPLGTDDFFMTASNRVVLSSDHNAIQLRQAIAVHIAAHGWVPVDIGPTTPESTHYPKHGEAAARLVASGDCRFGVILCGTGQGIMMAANKVKGIRCGACVDTFSARMIRQHNDANMLSIGARVVGEGLALDIVDAFLTAQFEGGRHATRVEMIGAMEARPPERLEPGDANWALRTD
ncbi:ribose 5-phosphate isomerase B [Phenylobacterium sp.]|uniref:ribose 5-phosphate isomerase B n=1 Tax=Phenylobacterium sp. TaxID=1871053 RepID=UPI002F401931